jgi:hypothetical protein
MWAHELHRALREAAMGDPDADGAGSEKRPSARDAMMAKFGIPA